MSLSGHQSATMKSDTWLTPPEILAKLGTFDLDPCCPPSMPWRTAKKMIQRPKDGLAEKWEGRVWLNPPFGREAIKWLDRMDEHGYGTALIAARTETKAWFRYVWPRASGVLFLRGRPHFYHPDGTRASFNSGAPIALVSYGDMDADYLRSSRLGEFIPLNSKARTDSALVEAKSSLNPVSDDYQTVENDSTRRGD